MPLIRSLERKENRRVTKVRAKGKVVGNDTSEAVVTRTNIVAGDILSCLLKQELDRKYVFLLGFPSEFFPLRGCFSRVFLGGLGRNPPKYLNLICLQLNSCFLFFCVCVCRSMMGTVACIAGRNTQRSQLQVVICA